MKTAVKASSDIAALPQDHSVYTAWLFLYPEARLGKILTCREDSTGGARSAHSYP
jgi:hypothetical protein